MTGIIIRRPYRGTSLVAQCRGLQVQSLLQEDPTRHEATKPVHHYS